MTRVILHRLLIAVPVLFLMSILTFVLVSFLPGDAARSLLGNLAAEEEVDALRQQLGLNQSLFHQYWTWLVNLAHGDLGLSLISGEPVTDVLRTRFPVTLVLVLATTVVSAIIGISLGVLSALRGGISGRVVDVVAFAGLACPNFWIGLGLIALFAVSWQIFPPNGYVPFGDSPVEWMRSLALPVAALAIGAVSTIATQTRDSMLDALGRDFVRVQFANGFSPRSIALKYVLRTAAPAILTLVGLVFVGLLGGAVLVETVFALPGMGRQVVTATTQHDIPVLQGAVLYLTAIVLTVNLLIDISYSWADPRVRVR